MHNWFHNYNIYYNRDPFVLLPRLNPQRHPWLALNLALDFYIISNYDWHFYVGYGPYAWHPWYRWYVIGGHIFDDNGFCTVHEHYYYYFKSASDFDSSLVRITDSWWSTRNPIHYNDNLTIAGSIKLNGYDRYNTAIDIFDAELILQQETFPNSNSYTQIGSFNIGEINKWEVKDDNTIYFETTIPRAYFKQSTNYKVYAAAHYNFIGTSYDMIEYNEYSDKTINITIK